MDESLERRLLQTLEQMFEVRNKLLKLDAVEAYTGFPFRIMGLPGMIQPIKEDGRKIQDMTDFADG